jgi:hypothetical protein
MLFRHLELRRRLHASPQGTSAPDEKFNRWYNDFHIPDMLYTGLYYTANRYESLNIQGSMEAVGSNVRRPVTDLHSSDEAYLARGLADS